MDKQHRLAVLDTSEGTTGDVGTWLGHWKLDKLESVRRRSGTQGGSLPVLGLVGDLVPAGLDEVLEYPVSVGKDVLRITEGTVDESVHLVVVVRPDGRVSRRRSYAHVKVLYELGVRQMMSVTCGAIDHEAPVNAVEPSRGIDFADLSDAPVTGFAVAAESCPRVSSELRIAMLATSFGELPGHLIDYIDSDMAREQTAAQGFGMCFAGFVTAGNRSAVKRQLEKSLAKIARHGVSRTRVAVSCTCL